MVGSQAVRVDIADRLLREAHAVRAAHGRRAFALDPAKAVSTGLKPENFARLLGLAGFRSRARKPLPNGAHGPPAPARWQWRPPRPQPAPSAAKATALPAGSPFAALADLAL